MDPGADPRDPPAPYQLLDAIIKAIGRLQTEVVKLRTELQQVVRVTGTFQNLLKITDEKYNQSLENQNTQHKLEMANMNQLGKELEDAMKLYADSRLQYTTALQKHKTLTDQLQEEFELVKNEVNRLRSNDDDQP